MIGSYGEWAASHLPAEHGSLSLLEAKGANRPSGLDAWRKAARQKVRDLLVLKPLAPKPGVRVLRAYEHDGLRIEELAWQLPYGPETRALFLKPTPHSFNILFVL